MIVLVKGDVKHVWRCHSSGKKYQHLNLKRAGRRRLFQAPQQFRLALQPLLHGDEAPKSLMNGKPADQQYGQQFDQGLKRNSHDKAVMTLPAGALAGAKKYRKQGDQQTESQRQCSLRRFRG